jgi:hypothetical protein
MSVKHQGFFNWLNRQRWAWMLPEQAYYWMLDRCQENPDGWRPLFYPMPWRQRRELARSRRRGLAHAAEIEMAIGRFHWWQRPSVRVALWLNERYEQKELRRHSEATGADLPLAERFGDLSMRPATYRRVDRGEKP